MKRLLMLAALTLGTASAAPFVYPAAWFEENPANAKMGGEVKNTNLSDFKTLNPFTSAEAGSLPLIMGDLSAGLFSKTPPTAILFPSWLMPCLL